MSPALIGILMFALMTVLILVGAPLAISMFFSSIVGFLLLGGWGVLTAQLTTGIMNVCANYSFAVIPLFMVMGSLCSDTGIGEGTFTAAKKWIGGVHGGLLDAVVIANMIFGACSGVSAAGNIVFSRIALPELDKHGYDRGLSLGTITCAGSLSVLIPPSMPILVFALMTNVSVGNALVAGISTGILFAAFMLIMLNVIIRIKPGLVPPKSTEKVTLKEKITTLKLLLPILLLFALVVGGSFLGWFPATVGGAVAFVAVFIYAVCKRMTFKKIWLSIWDGLKGFGNVYFIVIAGTLFGRVITMSGLADTVASFIISLNVTPFVVFLMVILFYMFCGCFMDCLSIIIITVPIVYPVLTGLGYDPIVLVMLLVFAMEIANLTPPVGLSVFYVANATGESPTFIFKNVVVYFIMDLVFVLLFALVPDIILWLPRLVGY